jgi:hypothetical protein
MDCSGTRATRNWNLPFHFAPVELFSPAFHPTHHAPAFVAQAKFAADTIMSFLSILFALSRVLAHSLGEIKWLT